MENIELIPSKEIERGAVLGSGSFGTVYKGVWSEFQVAIKTFRHDLNKAQEAEFKREANTMARLRHPLIVYFYGICTEPGHHAMLMEFMDKGDLYKLLQDKKQALPWNPLRWQLGIDIGIGLTYLHGKGILHRDLKSLNVLLTKTLRAKIADFGLSRIKVNSGPLYTQTAHGSLPWRAPELFKNKELDRPADVYAYGMVLWEISSRKAPFHDVLSPWAIPEKVKQGKRPGISGKCPSAYAAIIKECWAQEPKERPTASDVVKRLKQARLLKNEVVKPTKTVSLQSIALTTETLASVSLTDTVPPDPAVNLDNEKPEEKSDSSSEDNVQPVEKAPNIFEYECLQTLYGHIRSVTSLQKLSTGQLVSASSDGLIKIWDLSKGKYTRTMGGHKGPIYALRLLSSGAIVSSSADKTIKIWKMPSGKCVKTLQGHERWIESLVELSSGGIASGSADKTIRLWGPKDPSNPDDWQCLKILKGHEGAIVALQELTSGQLVSGAHDNTIKVWDVLTGKCVRTLEGHTQGVIRLQELKSGHLASGSSDKTIKIWDVESGKCLQTLEEHQGPVSALLELCSGYLASGSSDKTIKIWNASTGECLKTLKGHKASVYDLIELLSGQIASASSDKSIRIWGENPYKLSVVKTFTAFPPTPAKKGGSSRVFPVASVGLLPDGSLLTYSHKAPGFIKVWDIQKGTCTKEFSVNLKKQPKTWPHCTVLPTGTVCLYGGGAYPLVLDPENEFAIVDQFKRSFVQEVLALPGNRLLIGRRSDVDHYSKKETELWNELIVWDLEKKEHKKAADVSSPSTSGTSVWENGEVRYNDSDGPMITAMASYGKGLIAVSLSSGGLRIYDSTKHFGQVKAFGLGHVARSICPINDRFIATYGDLPKEPSLGLKSKPQIKIWDMETYTCVHSVDVDRPKNNGNHLAMIGPELLAFGNGLKVQFFNTQRNYQVVHSMTPNDGKSDTITNVEALPGNRMLVSFAKGGVSILGKNEQKEEPLQNK